VELATETSREMASGVEQKIDTGQQSTRPNLTTIRQVCPLSPALLIYILAYAINE
jgi:hypothetical protein